METLIRPFDHQYASYLRDESRMEGRADLIAFPRTEEETRDILRACTRDNIPVTVQGARTGLAGAASPDGGLVLNLSRMDRVTACGFDGTRFTLTAQAGVALCELRKMISARRFVTEGWSRQSLDALTLLSRAPEQFFPPDPTETTATLGGMAACNASGARTYLYGAMRTHVQALTLLLTDGRKLVLARGEQRASGRHLTLFPDSGSPVDVGIPTYAMPETKNTSSYFAKDGMDAIDLIIGSDGTLGVIADVTVVLSPLPGRIAGAMCLFDSTAQAVGFVEKLRTDARDVASVEYFDGYALDVLRDQRQSHAGFTSLPKLEPWIGAAIYVELHCKDDEAVIQRLNALSLALASVGCDDANTWVARNGSDLDRMMFFRHAVPESVNLLIDKRKRKDSGITKLGSDMAVPPHRRLLRAKRSQSGTSVRDVGTHRQQPPACEHPAQLHGGVPPRQGAFYGVRKDRRQPWRFRLIGAWRRQAQSGLSARHVHARRDGSDARRQSRA
jgi:D-lactate dehydrogenase (cytochrome)